MDVLQCVYSILDQYSTCASPEIVRKTKFVGCFQGLSNRTLTQYGPGKCDVNFYNNPKLNKESYTVNIFEYFINFTVL